MTDEELLKLVIAFFGHCEEVLQKRPFLRDVLRMIRNEVLLRGVEHVRESIDLQGLGHLINEGVA